MAVDPALLRPVPLFNGMTDSSIALIADLGSEVAFGPGDVLVAEGDPGDAFFVLLSGRAEVTQDGSSVGTLGPGSMLGEISLVDGRPRTATVTAVDPVAAITIERAGFLQLIDRFPSVRLGVLMSLTERVRRDMDAATA